VKSAVKGRRGSIRMASTAGKLIKIEKRHALVDTLGPLLHALVAPAAVQDRELSTWFGQFPFLNWLFADSACAGPVFHGTRAPGTAGLCMFGGVGTRSAGPFGLFGAHLPALR
jgi:hypothetical protein